MFQYIAAGQRVPGGIFTGMCESDFNQIICSGVDV